MTEVIKCSVRAGKFVEPCGLLREAAEKNTPSGKRKGVFAWEMSTREEGPTRTFYGAKSGDHTENGIVFSFCPFCGERIDGPVE